MDKDKKEYLKKHRPNFRTYHPNGTFLGIPLTKEKETVLKEIKVIDDYITSECPLEFKEAIYCGTLYKDGGMLSNGYARVGNELVEQYLMPFKNCSSINRVIDEINNIKKMTHVTQRIKGRLKICPCREVVVDEKFLFPYIGIFYKVDETDSDAIRDSWDKYGPMSLIIQPRFAECTGLFGPRKTDKLILELNIDCEENKREELYNELLTELKSCD